MYSELSTQFQYNESEFKAAKTYEMLKVFCPICSTIFEQTKHQIRTNWKRSPSKVLFCTRTCSMLGRSKIQRETDNCLHCNKEFIKVTTNVKTANKKFCSKICSANYINLNRTKEERDEISKKVSVKMLGKCYRSYRFLTQNIRYGYTLKYNICIIISTKKFYELKCQICNKAFKHKIKTTKLCSKQCFKIRLQKVHDEYPHLILNRSNPESYLEKSFREYIESKGYVKGTTFIQEKQWKLSTGKRYISDFYFPDLNLIVEMDGKQHQDTIEEDELKDSLLKQEFNLNTIRITHKQWRAKEKAEILESVL